MPWAWTPPIRSDSSRPHPPWLWALPGLGHPQRPRETRSSVFPPSQKKSLLIFNSNFPSCNFYPLLLLYHYSPWAESTLVSLWDLQILGGAMRSPQNLLFSRQNDECWTFTKLMIYFYHYPRINEKIITENHYWSGLWDRDVNNRQNYSFMVHFQKSKV